MNPEERAHWRTIHDDLADRAEDVEGGGAEIALLNGYGPALPGALPALAAVYADHPDYRDEWKP